MWMALLLCKNLLGSIFLSQNSVKSFITSPSMSAEKELSLSHLHFICLTNSALIWSRLKVFTIYFLPK